MRKIAILAIVGSAAFFITCDFFWMSKYFLKKPNNGSMTESFLDCATAVRGAFPVTIMKNTVLDSKVYSLRQSLKRSRLKSSKLFGTVPSSKKYLLIGIPTISRKKENYLHQTLQSLISNMNTKESGNVTIMVLFVDSDADLRLKRAKETALKFSESIRSGILLLAQTLPELYPRVNITRRTFNDSLDRIKWRSKQVLDFTFLVTYSHNLSEYFLILEDDVVATPRFVTSIQNFVQEKKNSDWVSLTFSGFFIIGRLMKSDDLKKLSEFLVLFHLEKPVDLLIMQFLDLLVPSTQTVTRRIPSLFQHIGLFSSLDGKVQKARDGSYTGGSRVFHFENPSADIVTTLGVYKKHYPELCYADSHKFFWGSAPKRNDTFDVIFRKPTKVKRIFISSGMPSHKNDVIKYAQLKVAPAFRKMFTDRKADCLEFHTAALFEKGKVHIVYNSTSKSEIIIQCVRIEFIKRHSNWVLINEISIDSEELDL